ncbi:MAG: sodium/glutamate symporter [Thermosynechococcaceae cyanobacterium]
MRGVFGVAIAAVTIALNGLTLLLASIFILALGKAVTEYLPRVQRLNIPASVIGGLLASMVLSGLSVYTPLHVEFDLALRDACLLIFFAALGFTARLSLLRDGGRTLAVLFGITVVFLVAQNITGVLVAYLLKQPLLYGLLAGTIAFAGGHATAITWGSIIETQGVTNAVEFGTAAATFGLVLGGLLGGPITQRLIQRHGLRAESTHSLLSDAPQAPEQIPVTLNAMMGAAVVLGVAIAVGLGIHSLLLHWGVIVPSFLPILIAGAILTNLLDYSHIDINQSVICLVGDMTLQLFLVMSLMSLQWWTLTASAGPLVAILAAQGFMMILFAYFVVFPLVGRDYDASVLCAGFTGLGLGATPIGIANMQAITDQHGASPKAFLLIPLMGVFCLDITNSVIIQGCLQLPLLAQG